MFNEDKKRLENEIRHIFESGANELRVYEMVVNFIEGLRPIEINQNKITTYELQKCPKCDGQGSVSKPPYVPGDVHQWSSTSATHICDVCNGQKIIPQFIPAAEK